MEILPLSVTQVPELSVRGDAGVQYHIYFFPNTEGWRLDWRLLCISNSLMLSAEAPSQPRKKIQELQ